MELHKKSLELKENERPLWEYLESYHSIVGDGILESTKQELTANEVQALLEDDSVPSDVVIGKVLEGLEKLDLIERSGRKLHQGRQYDITDYDLDDYADLELSLI